MLILHRYFARRFVFSLVSIFAAFLLFSGFLNLIEQLRRFRDTDASFADIISLTLLSLPEGLYRILPLIVILAAISLFLGLARSSEMIVTRAAGRSALRALLAPALVALLLGLLVIGVINPIVASTSKEFEARSSAFFSETPDLLAFSGEGLWLRQGGPSGQTVIRADRANLNGTELFDVSFFRYGADLNPLQRIEAERATLRPGAWFLENAKVWPLTGSRNSEARASVHSTIELPSTLTADQIKDSFGTPSSIPIWELPEFIARLELAGFSARRHQVWFQVELAQPAFLIAMVLIAAGFTMRQQRSGRTGFMVLAAVLLGFGLYFIRNFAIILGENGQIPVLLAAWAPPLSAIGLSLGLLLHLEDG